MTTPTPPAPPARNDLYARRTNPRGACASIEVLIGATDTGASESFIEAFMCQAPMGATRVPGARIGNHSKHSVASYLKRLRREGRVVSVDTPDGRVWCTPEQHAEYVKQAGAA